MIQMARSKHHLFKRVKGLMKMTRPDSVWRKRSNEMKQLMKLTIKEQQLEALKEITESSTLNVEHNAEKNETITIGSSMGVIDEKK